MSNIENPIMTKISAPKLVRSPRLVRQQHIEKLDDGLNNLSSFCYEHFYYNTQTSLYTCKYCRQNFDQERQNRLKRQLVRHLNYHHPMLKFPSNTQKQNKNSDILCVEKEKSTTKNRDDKLGKGLEQKIYDHFRIDSSKREGVCLDCQMIISKVKSAKPLEDHLRKYHVDKLQGANTHWQNSQRHKKVPIEHQHHKLYDPKVGSLKLDFGVGVSRMKSKWILTKQMGLTHQAAKLYIQQLQLNQGRDSDSIATEPNCGQKLIKFLVQKKSKVVKRLIVDPLTSNQYLSFVVISQQMEQNMQLFGEHLYIDVMQRQRSQDFRVVALVWGSNRNGRRSCMGIFLFQSEIYSDFEPIFCEYLAEIAKLPESLHFRIPSLLFDNGWDPRPMFDQLNTHIMLLDNEFSPYTQPVVVNQGRAKVVRISKRAHYFVGLQEQKPQGKQPWFRLPSELEEISAFKIVSNIYNRQSKLEDEISLESFHRFYSKIFGSSQWPGMFKGQGSIERRGQKQRAISEMILSDEQLIRLGFLVCAEVYTVLVEQYYKSVVDLAIEAKWRSGNEQKAGRGIKCEVFSRGGGERNVLSFHVESDCWHCDCLMLCRSGVPCSHLIKIVRYFNGSLSYYLNCRWVKDVGRTNLSTQVWQVANQQLPKSEASTAGS